MSQNTIYIPTDGSMSPKSWYQVKRASHDFAHDVAQEAAIDELDELWHQLVEFKNRRNQFLGRSLLSPDVPKGLYLWGGVGRGKTLLMDMFYACLPYRRKRRIHFHNFMTEVHHEMKRFAAENDPLIALADKIEISTRLLCLDEFHVEDIADAMILQRLIEAMLVRGVVLITTSNTPPDGLYANGLQRRNFLPAIALLKRELKVIQIDGGDDYRLRAIESEPLFLVADDNAGTTENEARLDSLFERIAEGSAGDFQQIQLRGRMVPVKKIARDMVWFDFKELCGGAHAQEDYLQIAHRFPTVFLSHIPRMASNQADEARRFIWLIDVLYDNHVRLVATSAATPDQIYTDGINSVDFSRTTSRLIEMQTLQYLQLPHQAQSVSL